MYGVAIALFAALVAPAGAQGKLDVPTHREVLDNGLTVILAPDRTVPLVAVRVTYRVGSRNEHTGITGMAHFLEHMMFNGTAKYGPKMFDRVLERAGGSGNAYTTRDLTWYTTTVPPQSLGTVLELEADRMTGLEITEAAFANELQVVLEERRQTLEVPELTSARVEFLSSLFRAHPYRWPVIGWRSDIEAYDVARVRAFYRTHYAPNNAVLALAGDLDPAVTMALVREHFGPLTRGEEIPPVHTREPATAVSNRLTMRRNVANPTLFLGFVGPRASDGDHAAMDLIHEVLSRGPTGRLYRRLALEERIATKADLAHDWMLDPEPLFIEVGLVPGGDVARAESIVRAELRRMREELVPEAELERAVTSRTAWLLRYGLARPDDRATFLGRAEALLGDHRRVLELPEIWRAITPRQIRDAAARYLDDSHVTTAVMIPEDE